MKKKSAKTAHCAFQVAKQWQTNTRYNMKQKVVMKYYWGSHEFFTNKIFPKAVSHQHFPNFRFFLKLGLSSGSILQGKVRLESIS